MPIRYVAAVPVFAMSAATCAPWRQSQQFGRLDLQHGRELLDNFEACIEGAALFKLAEIAPAHLGLIGKVVLRQPFRMAQPTQIGSKDLAQIHAPSEAVRCPPLTRCFKPTKIIPVVKKGCGQGANGIVIAPPIGRGP